ncbi:MAG: hypothetical protein Q7J84_09085 [Sulfuricaulis sp.]|nr:hypothetical protein [Sulfuricaulis sp.]
MKFFDTLLGFAVLTGPLWLILLALLLGIGIAVLLAKRLKRKPAKFVGAVGVFLILFLLLFGDEIAGRIYLNHLCATETGVKVYKTVELPAEYWDEQGRAKIQTFKSDAPGIIRLIGTSVPSFDEISFTELYSPSFHIEKAGFRLREIESKNVTGEIVYFMYWGGWARRNLSPHNSATSCELKNLDGWEYNIFQRSVGK